MDSLIINVAVTAAILLIIAALLQTQVNARGGCPTCGTHVPLFRNPTSLRQGLWGGWTCESCGTEMDRRGREIKPEQAERGRMHGLR